MIKELEEFAILHQVPIMDKGGETFLLSLVEERKVKTILELGTAIGYTSINLCTHFKEIEIDTIERNEEMKRYAEENILKSGFSDRIHLHKMDTADYISDKKYDLIIVDDGKVQYAKRFEKFKEYLSDNGCLFFDDMVFHDMIYDLSCTKQRSTKRLLKKLIEFRKEIVCKDNYEATFYDKIGDGILIVTRRGNNES